MKKTIIMTAVFSSVFVSLLIICNKRDISEFTDYSS